jgi:hypothetical protein
MSKELRPLDEKHFIRLSEKIEDAINNLGLENTVNMPDFVIAEMLTSIFEAITIAVQATNDLRNSKLIANEKTNDQK